MKIALAVVAEVIKNRMSQAKVGLMGVACQMFRIFTSRPLPVIDYYRFLSIAIDFVNR